MVCQKEEGCEIDFENQGIMPYIDGDFIKAEEVTTTTAANGKPRINAKSFIEKLDEIMAAEIL